MRKTSKIGDEISKMEKMDLCVEEMEDELLTAPIGL
jgi:hypothetical protein